MFKTDLSFQQRFSGWRTSKRLGVLVFSLILAGCAVGPDYRLPVVQVGSHYKEAQGWKPAQPGDQAPRPDWWRSFEDNELNGLMDEMLGANLSIAQAEARYRQAQALVRSAGAGFFPTIGSTVSATRSGAGSGGAGASGGTTGSQYSLSGNVSWEVDLWGRVRRTVEAGQAGAQAGASDVAATRLSMQSTLAQTYFQLRAFDTEKELFGKTVQAYERSLEMTQNRYAAGVAAQADVATARTQLENARAQMLALDRQRAQLEHALAVLLGRPPSQLDVTVGAISTVLPAVPVGLPSQLLERRPDIAAAERRTAAANARIGVAQAAWFPDLTLSVQGGYRASQWAQWLSAPFHFWSLGPALALTVFDGGARQGQLDEARAAYDEQVAAYRLTVLTALQEVEDYLVALRVLEQEQETQGRALASARESLQLTQNQYDAGLIDYLSVVQVEATALSAERAAVSLRLSRLLASVQLMTALGGGWQVPEDWQQPRPAEAEVDE
ncbi:MAG TPA: efflux transporter outer membrane subunit [Pusillimonas sp.]|uniref:efflux transporter outer membrane subunit n=1 Tax=Pusillimonas sp. TaxID=3040095 RepID=UPI002C93D33B|nr:efflux transporter outer membrane subunit [Pusillimonas sp.]HUH88518.1 efflux transporter outer membrane subunit [Pusillimonas sp.]